MYRPPPSDSKEEVYQKIIHSCWRCGHMGVVRDVELGLCIHCLEILKDPDYVKRWDAPVMHDGPASREARDVQDRSDD